MPFSQKTLQFLFENRLHDSREWFWEHKADYQRYVYEPLQELTEQLAPHMLKIDSRFTTEPRVDKTICRIRRDTRYSHDKSLYRDTMWIIFKRGKMHSTEVPGMHFEITCDGFNYGGGFHQASTGYMDTLRSMVLSGDALFLKANKAYTAQQTYRIQGECYKRPHYPHQPEGLRLWLERRNISFLAENSDFELLFSRHLADYLAEQFARFAPIYQFLLHAALQEQQRLAALAAQSIGHSAAVEEEW